MVPSSWCDWMNGSGLLLSQRQQWEEKNRGSQECFGQVIYKMPIKGLNGHIKILFRNCWKYRKSIGVKNTL